MTDARILVVDDSATNRLKMTAALRHLGYGAQAAAGGQQALDALRAESFDAVLLDIVMPDMDGFAVLRVLKGDEELRDVPVIVVSSLDDDLASVVQAIELGAEDFLPKDFEPVVLKARLSASLEKKRWRDQEREYRRLVERLTQAAEALESGMFRPDRLSVDDVAARDNSLGGLARVFKGMAREIYERERRMRRNLRTLRGSLLVMAVGASWGIVPPLSRMASVADFNPVTLVFWVNVIGAVLCLAISAVRGKLPVPSWALLRFCLIAGAVAGVGERIVMLWVTDHLQASTVTLISSLEGFLVFAIATSLGMESANLKRLGGLLCGLAGAALVVVSPSSLASDASFWLLVAMSLPLAYALEGIYTAARRPAGVDAIALAGLISVASTLVILPAVISSPASNGSFSAIPIMFFVIAFLMAVATALANIFWLHLVAIAGPVFASQTAYSGTIAGIVWSMLLLDERLAPFAWVALALMMIGLYLVEPRASSEDDEFRLPLGVERTDT